MGIQKKCLTMLTLFFCLVLSGCGTSFSSDSDKQPDTGNQNSLANLKERAAEASQFSCDFTRRFGTETVEGRLHFKEDNIRFEMFGASPEDTTVTIVNQEENKTYTYNNRMNKGQVDEPAAFLLDVPLPGEIMSALTVDNCSFTGQPERDGQKCTAFQATDVQFYGYKFTGEIVIANQSGLPIYISGKRGEIPVAYEYRNFSDDVSTVEFLPPETISFD